MNSVIMALFISATLSLPHKISRPADPPSLSRIEAWLNSGDPCPQDFNRIRCIEDMKKLRTLILATHEANEKFENALPRALEDFEELIGTARESLNARESLRDWLEHLWKTYNKTGL